MPSHCPDCRRQHYDVGTRDFADCPGCPECERLRMQLEQATKAAGLEKTECERLQRMLTHANEDWADTNTKIRDILRPILGAQETDGDSYGVPTLEYIVGRLRATHDEARESAMENLGRFLRMAKSCEEVGKERDALRAELLSVRESLQRERAGQGKCNAGHISDRALWDCPVCVETMRVERDQWKDRANNSYRAGIGEVWHWQGDEYDHPQLLTCPVLMSADQVREFIAMRARLTLAERVVKAEQATRVVCDGVSFTEDLLRIRKAREELHAALAAWEVANG